MTVKDFIPITDVKQTVEKEVKQKPKLAELITVESPGKPSPASELEALEEKQKKRASKRAPRSAPSKIEKPVKDSILIITEKPQAAEKIANALGKARKYTEDNASYFEIERNNRKVVIASAVGHLFGLDYVKGQKGWPIFEVEWRPTFEKKNAAFTRKYYSLLQKLSRKAEEIIIATDYDVEGEVIGWNVLRFICRRPSAKRMKYSTLTKDELEKSYENPLSEPDWGQAYAGESRHILDWLYGINLSRALMSAIKTAGSFKILSIGRVQGPALKIIVNREKEILNFKPEPYWQVFVKVKDHYFKHPKDIFDKKELEKFKDIKSCFAETKESEESLLPPHPFDLTTLQKEAYRLHKIGPSQALSIAQKLYLNGLISYPRTSSQKIPDSIEPKKILKSLSKFFPEVKEANRSKPVEGKKTDPAHPSIFPTGEYNKLTENEKRIYELIVRRFIAVFSKDAITQNKKVAITADKNPEITFTCSGLKIKEKGWTKVYPATIEEKDIPTLNGHVDIDEIKIEEKETQPPKRYTPTSLVALLEKKNLGTKTTRSMIVDILFERGYLDGKSIQATPLGVKLIDTLDKYSPIIIDENLTRQLEEEMEKIQNADAKNKNPSELEKKEKEIVEKAKRLIIDISKEFKAKEHEIGKGILEGIQSLRNLQNENNILITCPTCKNGDLRVLFSAKTRRSFVACSNYPNCTRTYSLPPNALIKKSGAQCPDCLFPRLLAIRKGKRPWEFCFNIDCPSNKKMRDEWERKKALYEKNNEKAVSSSTNLNAAEKFKNAV